MNNIRQSSQQIKKNLPDGEYLEWKTTGTLIVKGQYQAGKKQGLWTKYLSRTEIEEEGRYQNGLKEGTWKTFWPQGSIRTQQEYKQGEKVGVFQEWFADGILKVSHNCHENGSFKEFFYNGNPKVEYPCKKGKLPVGQIKHYNLLNQLDRIEHYNSDGQKHGTWVWFNMREDTLALRTYHLGKLHGPQKIDSLEFQFVHGTGRIQIPCPQESKFSKMICLDSNWVNSNLHDTIINWELAHHLNRKKNLDPESKSQREVKKKPLPLYTVETWKHGQQLYQKSYRFINPNKKFLSVEGGYQNNLKHGTWKVWYPNGKINKIINFKEDLYFGKQILHDSTGTPTMIKTYQGPNQKVLVEILNK